jgi:hypothetical protein
VTGDSLVLPRVSAQNAAPVQRDSMTHSKHDNLLFTMMRAVPLSDGSNPANLSPSKLKNDVCKDLNIHLANHNRQTVKFHPAYECDRFKPN